MDPEFADLVPLFVSEARGRVEHLADVAGRLGGDEKAAVEVKRELHTLKGAARMLRLAPLAELCHAAEGALLASPAGLVDLLTRVADRLAAMVETVAGGADPEPDADLLDALRGAPDGSSPTGTTAAGPASAPATATGGEIRLDPAAVDAMADRATRLRILSLGAAAFPARLTELARLAEQAVHEDQPGQVLAVLATSIRRQALEIEAGQRRLRRLAESHLETILSLQVQPLSGFFHTLARHARELARALGRELEVVTRGDETRLDRRIARELEEALLHTVRNAVDHGIEPPEARVAAGKRRDGTVRIEAAAVGARVRIVVADDGSGIDPSQIVAVAVARGVIDADDARSLSRDEALRLLFTPDFSTRDEVSEVSGRGVGLDAVAAVAGRVGGSVSIASQPGVGTTVTLEVPAARRGETVTLLRAGRLRFALPRGVIRSARRLPATAVVERDGRFLANFGDRLVPFVPLAQLFGEPPAGVQLLLEGEAAGQGLAVAVDAVTGEEEVLVRPVTTRATVTPLLDGVALLSDGEPVGVLSPSALALREAVRLAPIASARARQNRVRVLLVDDSLVTREMERRLLEDAGIDVAAAGDAGEALARLSGEPFDCLVTDIEMPGMDGFELTRHLRTIPHLAQLPIVVVSTRERPEDRLKGLEAGADAYLTKQALDATELVGLVRRLGGR